MSVCPLVALPSTCYAMQIIRPESYRWCRIMWLVIQWLVVVWVCVTLSKRPAHHRVMNSKLLCATTDPGSLYVQKQPHKSGGGVILFAHLAEVGVTALLSHENTGVWGQWDSHGDSSDKDTPESLSYVLLEDFIPVFKSLSWSCLVHLKLDAQPYSFSRMGLSLERTGLLCWLWHWYLP